MDFRASCATRRHGSSKREARSLEKAAASRDEIRITVNFVGFHFNNGR
jgi:hypothetical protein